MWLFIPMYDEPFYLSSFMSYYLFSTKDLFFIIQSQLKPLKEEFNEQIHSQICVSVFLSFFATNPKTWIITSLGKKQYMTQSVSTAAKNSPHSQQRNHDSLYSSSF